MAPPTASNGLPELPKDPLPDWMKKGRKPLKQFVPVDLGDQPSQGSDFAPLLDRQQILLNTLREGGDVDMGHKYSM